MKRIDYLLFSAKVRIISECANLLPKIFKKNCRKSTEHSTKKPHYSHEQRGIQILKNTFASEQNDVCSSAKVRIFSLSASIFTIFFVFCVHFFVLKKTVFKTVCVCEPAYAWKSSNPDSTFLSLKTQTCRVIERENEAVKSVD